MIIQIRSYSAKGGINIGTKNNNHRIRSIILAGIALAAVVALTLVYALPRPLSKQLFPDADELKIDGMSVTVTILSKQAEAGDNLTNISGHEKVGGLESLLREAKVTFCGHYSDIVLNEASYGVTLYMNEPDSIPSREDCSFKAMEGDNKHYIYVTRPGTSGGDKYKMSADDFGRLISILQTLAANK